MMKQQSMAAAYDSAGAGAQGGPSTFSDDYDAAGADTTGKSDGDADQDDQQQDIDIPAANVTQMQALKDKGDMAGLGQYVSQFLK